MSIKMDNPKGLINDNCDIEGMVKYAIQCGSMRCLQSLTAYHTIDIEDLYIAMSEPYTSAEMLGWIIKILGISTRSVCEYYLDVCEQSIKCCDAPSFFGSGDIVDIRGLEPRIALLDVMHIKRFFDKNICISLSRVLFFSALNERFLLFKWLFNQVQYREQLEARISLGSNITDILSVCLKRGYKEGLSMLYHRGCCFNRVINGETLLMELAKLRGIRLDADRDLGCLDTDMIDMIIEYGCNPVYFNADGVSCEVIATTHGDVVMVQFLQMLEGYLEQ